MVQDGAFNVKRSESSRRRYKRRDESVTKVIIFFESNSREYEREREKTES